MIEIKDQIDRNKLPVHVAVIMDGNGRWAKSGVLPGLSVMRKGWMRCAILLKPPQNLALSI